jgi:hypothetical protein
MGWIQNIKSANTYDTTHNYQFEDMGDHTLIITLFDYAKAVEVSNDLISLQTSYSCNVW